MPTDSAVADAVDDAASDVSILDAETYVAHLIVQTLGCATQAFKLTRLKTA